MTKNRRSNKCPVCETYIVFGPHALCEKGEDTGYRLTEEQVIVNRAESIIRRATWGWRNP